jgi:hypothetical protein
LGAVRGEKITKSAFESFIILTHPIFAFSKKMKATTINLISALCIVCNCVLHAQSQQPKAPFPKYEIDPERPLDTIFQFVEHMPEFPGGFLAMEAFLKECTGKEKWPVNASVFLQLVIERDGSFSKVNAVRSSDEYLSGKAIECAKNMPAWKPGMKNGVTKRVLFTLPIQFKAATSEAAAKTYSEEWAEFTGGYDAMINYMNECIAADTTTTGLSGEVITEFVIAKDGVPGNITVLKSPSKTLSEAVAKCILSMPLWKPAKVAGRPVPTTYKLPITIGTK